MCLFCKNNCYLITRDSLKVNLVSASSWFDAGRALIVSSMLHVFSPLLMINGISIICLKIRTYQSEILLSEILLSEFLWRFPQNIPVSIFWSTLFTWSLWGFFPHVSMVDRPWCVDCNNSNINNYLTLVGVFHNSFSYNFQLIALNMLRCYRARYNRVKYVVVLPCKI